MRARRKDNEGREMLRSTIGASARRPRVKKKGRASELSPGGAGVGLWRGVDSATGFTHGYAAVDSGRAEKLHGHERGRHLKPPSHSSITVHTACTTATLQRRVLRHELLHGRQAH